MVYKSLHGLAANYLSSNFIPRGDVITSKICAILKITLLFPYHVRTIIKIAFAIVVQYIYLWNSLPSAARQATS